MKRAPSHDYEEPFRSLPASASRLEALFLARYALRAGTVEATRTLIGVTPGEQAFLRQLIGDLATARSLDYRKRVLQGYNHFVENPELTLPAMRPRKKVVLPIGRIKKLRARGQSWPMIADEIGQNLSTLVCKLRYDPGTLHAPCAAKKLESEGRSIGRALAAMKGSRATSVGGL
jgi:hypothetical protein